MHAFNFIRGKGQAYCEWKSVCSKLDIILVSYREGACLQTRRKAVVFSCCTALTVNIYVLADCTVLIMNIIMT